MKLAALFLGLFSTQSYVIVNGDSYVVVGKQMFDDYVRSKACTLGIETKRYPKQRLVEHRCYV